VASLAAIRLQRGFHAKLIEDTAGQFQLTRIVPAKIDGHTVIVTQGSHYARYGTHWQALTFSGPVHDFAVSNLDGELGDEIVTVGERTESVHLDKTPFADLPATP
jgi:hypothetical protein